MNRNVLVLTRPTFAVAAALLFFGPYSLRAQSLSVEPATGRIVRADTPAPPLTESAVRYGVGPVQYGFDNPGVTPGMSYSVQRLPDGPKPVLVINCKASDPKSQATLENDLPIMWKVLHNAVGKRFGAVPNSRTAMGIDVVFAPGSSPIRSLYLDGYGALFLLNVDFPLLAPPKKSDVQKANPRSDSAWEEAEHEVYGQPSGDGTVVNTPLAQEYDEEKVNGLKAAVFDALKSAANIRNLKPEDAIIVCISGWASESLGQERILTLQAPGGRNELVVGLEEDIKGQQALRALGIGEGGAPVRSAILNILVKKSDVDAYANGKMTLEEFRKRADVTIYPSQSGGLTASSDGYNKRLWYNKPGPQRR